MRGEEAEVRAQRRKASRSRVRAHEVEPRGLEARQQSLFSSRPSPPPARRRRLERYFASLRCRQPSPERARRRLFTVSSAARSSPSSAAILFHAGGRCHRTLVRRRRAVSVEPQSSAGWVSFTPFLRQEARVVDVPSPARYNMRYATQQRIRAPGSGETGTCCLMCASWHEATMTAEGHARPSPPVQRMPGTAQRCPADGALRHASARQRYAHEREEALMVW